MHARSLHMTHDTHTHRTLLEAAVNTPIDSATCHQLFTGVFNSNGSSNVDQFLTYRGDGEILTHLSDSMTVLDYVCKLGEAGRLPRNVVLRLQRLRHALHEYFGDELVGVSAAGSKSIGAPMCGMGRTQSL
jgi:hypothetical protein